MAAFRDDTPQERARLKPTDSPRPGVRARRLIAEAQRLQWILDEARQELADATVSEDAELTIRASRRIYSIGALLFMNSEKLAKGPKLL